MRRLSLALSPYRHYLEEDENFRRWVEALERGSITTATNYFRKTAFACEQPGMTPQDVVKMDTKQATALLSVNSSLFSNPVDFWRILEPDPGVRVDSMVEYVLYQALKAAQQGGKLKFVPHQSKMMDVDGVPVDFHPDFTVYSNSGKTYFWEHLGMLDLRDYLEGWAMRRKIYEANGEADSLVTTDDLNGIDGSKLKEFIDSLANSSPGVTDTSPY